MKGLWSSTFSLKKTANAREGFTLLELMVVILLISLLLGIALPRFKGMQDQGRIAKAKAELGTLRTAVESYYLHHANTYPTDLTALATAVPNIVSSISDDPFAAAGTKYQYVRGGTNNKFFVIYSVGPNGNGSAAISGTNTVTETNGSSCIYVSNMGNDAQP